MITNIVIGFLLFFSLVSAMCIAAFMAEQEADENRIRLMIDNYGYL